MNADFVAWIGNCFVLGETFTNTPNRRIRNLIRLTINGLQIELHQNPETIAHGFRKEEHYGTTLHTTHLVVRGLPDTRLAEALSITTHVTELLGFANCQEAVLLGYEYVGVEKKRYSVVGTCTPSFPVLDPTFGRTYRCFLETAFQQYRALRDPRMLHVAFRYLVESIRPSVLEVRLVLTLVLLEHLKWTYGVSEGYPYIRDSFWKAGKDGKIKISFKTMLAEMFAKAGMSPNLDRAVTLRNEMIHSGLSALSIDERREMLAQCQNLIREYLLCLLGYSGDFIRRPA